MHKAAGRRLAKYRAASGLRLDDASARIRERVGPNLGVSRETIRRYEAGMVDRAKMDPITLGLMAEVYGTTLRELAPWVDLDEVQRLRDLLDRVSGCIAA